MRHDHYVHIPELAELFKPLLKMLDRIHKQGAQIMAKLSDADQKLTAMSADLVRITAAQANMAGDIADLVARAGQSTDQAEIDALVAKAAEIQATSQKLADDAEAAAAVYTPPTP